MKIRLRSGFGQFFIFLLLLCCNVADAEAQPQRTVAVQGEADPYEVTLYLSQNYANPIGTWKIAPGMRMLKIPQLDKIPHSIFLGSKVGAILFPEANFTSALQGFGAEFVTVGSWPEPKDPYLIPYWRFRDSAPVMFTKYQPPYRCSLVIHRKDVDDFLGVYLESGKHFGRFYPLPDKAGDSAIIYYKITEGGPFTLSLLPGGMGTMSLYPSLSPPNPNNIAVTITTPEGATVKIPEPNSTVTRFDLLKHGVQQISSLMVQYKGPFNEQAYLPVQAVRAPAAPDVLKPPPPAMVPDPPKLPPAVATTPPKTSGTISLPPSTQTPPTGQPGRVRPPNVSGQWSSNTGLRYQITQTDDRFEWAVRGSDERGRGQVRGSEVTVAWTGRTGRGSAQGRITATDSSGRAMQIEWDNGVRFSR